jgi:hypothetical protein
MRKNSQNLNLLLVSCAVVILGPGVRLASAHVSCTAVNLSVSFVSLYAGVTKPTVSTQAATGIGNNTATLNGKITNDGGQACQYRFRYRHLSHGWFYTDWTGGKTTGQAFSQAMSNLYEGTFYYFSAQARNSAGEGDWGADLNFTTTGDTRKTVVAYASTATLNGYVALGGSLTCQYRFRYKPAGGSYTYTAWTGSVNDATPYSQNISGLSSATIYYFSTQARNSVAEGPWDIEQSFTTIGVPSVSTQAATGVGNTTATLNGTVTNDGGQACQYRFRYRHMNGRWFYTDWTGSKTTGQSFSQPAYGLYVGTYYFFAAQAKNSAGESDWGNQLNFTTTGDTAQTVIAYTTPVTNIGATTATLNGFLCLDGAQACQYRFGLEGPSTFITAWTGSLRMGNPYTQNISGLSPGTTYNVATQARNSVAEGPWDYGYPDVSFTTLPVAAPSVSTEAATGIGATTATLNGTVTDGGGEACQYRFRYMPAAGSYTYTAWAGSAGTGQTFSEAVSGLKAGTHYLFAVQAQNSAGESDWGSELSFTTLAAPALKLSISSSAGGHVTVPGEGTFLYALGSSVPLAATPKRNCGFVHWIGTAVDAGKVANPNAATTTVVVDAEYTVKACFLSLLPTLYVDDNASCDPGPGDIAVSDPNEDGTQKHPFDSIQEAIEVASKAADIIVCDGLYQERLNLLGKDVQVVGAWLVDPNIMAEPVVDGNGVGPVLTFASGEDPNCVVAGLRIRGGKAASGAAILCRASSPTIRHCVVCGNIAAADEGGIIDCNDSKATFVNCTVSGNIAPANGALFRCADSNAVVANSILWLNATKVGDTAIPPAVRMGSGKAPAVSYSNIQGGWAGAGNMDLDPRFAATGQWRASGIPDDPNAVWVDGDYHLQSKRGYYLSDLGLWVFGKSHSPCIDAGDPTSDWSAEPSPDGGRINMGAYGGTTQASMSYFGEAVGP